MPFTPYHMGPGLLLKSLLNTSFSLMVFGWTQIVMDIQPLLVLITGEGHLHGFSHTLIGGSLIAFFAGFTGKLCVDWLLRTNPMSLSHKETQLLGLSHSLSWKIAYISAFIGSFSHVYLDAIMHADMFPFAPISTVNPALGILSVENLHKVCMYSGLVGAGLHVLIRIWKLRALDTR